MPTKPPIHRDPNYDRALCLYRNQCDRERGSFAKRGYGRKWNEAAKAYLRRHPLCVMCLKEERVEPAVLVDHVIPHKGNHSLFWNQENWQALCQSHHSRKTVTCDGGFGNAVR